VVLVSRRRRSQRQGLQDLRLVVRLSEKLGAPLSFR
jgi:hypothetical protein